MREVDLAIEILVNTWRNRSGDTVAP